MKLKLLSTLALTLSALSLKATEQSFQFSHGELKIGATITQTKAEPNWGAVLVSVAGPTDRDLTLGKHRYFAELATALKTHSIASIRYDDLGVGDSTGDLMQTSLADRVELACAAKNALSKQRQIPLNKIGFIGMSEGAGISLLANGVCGPNPFQVLLSAPLRPGLVELPQQMNRLIDSSLFTVEQKADIKTQGKYFFSLVSAPETQKNAAELLAFFKSPYGPLILPPYQFVPSQPEDKVQFVLSPWYQSQINYDVTDGLTGNSVPTLGIYGSHDQVIHAEDNLATLQSHLPQATTHLLPKINHLMQVSNTGSPVEYATLKSGFSEQVSELIGRWIAKSAVKPSH